MNQEQVDLLGHVVEEVPADDVAVGVDRDLA